MNQSRMGLFYPFYRKGKIEWLKKCCVMPLFQFAVLYCAGPAVAIICRRWNHYGVCSAERIRSEALVLTPPPFQA